MFTGRYEGPLSINEEEAMAVKWVPFEELEQDVMEHPERYTVWFITALRRFLSFWKRKRNDRLRAHKEENSRLADAECAQRRGVYQHYPEVLQIELTDRCNGRCIMCKHYYKGNHGAGDLANGVLAKLEEYLPFCRLVLLNGYGESLISSQYRSCMDLLKKYQVKVFVTSNLSVFYQGDGGRRADGLRADQRILPWEQQGGLRADQPGTYV